MCLSSIFFVLLAIYGSEIQSAAIPVSSITATITSYGCSTSRYGTTIDFVLAVSGGKSPFRYSVDNGIFTSNSRYSVDSEGYYNVTAIDSNGSNITTRIYIGPATKVIASGIPYVPYGSQAGYRTSAVGASDGFLSASAQAGVAPYKYTLYYNRRNVAHTGNANAFDNLAAGNYQLVATDANGCRSPRVTVTVHDPTLPSAPTDVNVKVVNSDPKVYATAEWQPPEMNGYAEIQEYVVMWGYQNGSSTIWNANQTVSEASATILEFFSNTTRRFVKVAAVNKMGMGPYSRTMEYQSLCVAGKFSLDKKCVDCPAGTSTMGTIGRSVCRECTMGTYSEAGAPLCSNCTGNTYSTFKASSCTKCPVGYVTEIYYCQPCPPGTYNTNTTTCTPCSENTYSAVPASVSCTPCPAGRRSARGASVCTDPSGYKK